MRATAFVRPFHRPNGPSPAPAWFDPFIGSNRTCPAPAWFGPPFFPPDHVLRQFGSTLPSAPTDQALRQFHLTFSSAPTDHAPRQLLVVSQRAQTGFPRRRLTPLGFGGSAGLRKSGVAAGSTRSGWHTRREAPAIAGDSGAERQQADHLRCPREGCVRATELRGGLQQLGERPDRK